MKKTIAILAVICSLAVTLQAQEARKDSVSKYFRNSLTQLMIYHPEDEFGYDVYKIFSDLPNQDKYDDHNISLRVIDNSKISGVAGKPKGGLHRQTYGGSMVLTKEEKGNNAQALLDLLNKAEVGKRMVAKWFGFTGETVQDAHFSTSLIEERSDYNASVLDVERARNTIDGMAALQNVGDELISHSFVLISDMTYITAENRADATKTTFAILGGVLDVLSGGNSGRRLAENVGDIADKFTGFKVFTHSYLYQLEWNDSIANLFYDKYYTVEPNADKVRAFLEDRTTFKLKYLGNESATSEKTTTNGTYSRDDLLQMISVRSIDNNVAKLQKRFDAFRVSAPITSIEYDKKGNVTGFRALIGEKEGVADDITYEVMRCVYDKGRLKYERVAVLKPVKNRIWDNRFNAIIENDEDGDNAGTLFKITDKTNASKVSVGMLIRQIKG